MKSLALGLAKAFAFAVLMTGCNFEQKISEGAALRAPASTSVALPSTSQVPTVVSLAHVPANLKGSSSIDLDLSGVFTSILKINSAQLMYSIDGTQFFPITDFSSSTKKYTWAVPYLDAPTAILKIAVTEANGKVIEQKSNTFQILSTPPHFTLTSSNAIANSLVSAQFTGACAPGATISYYPGLTAQTSAAVKAHYAKYSNFVCSAQGAWSFTPSESTLNTTFSYTLKISDIVGNTSQLSFTWARSCASGQYASGESCVAQTCAPTSVSTDHTGCSNMGTRTRSCSAMGSAWGAYGSCACSPGYTGATCSGCATGYFFNGTACIANTCSPGAVVADNIGCTLHGSRTETCNNAGSGFGNWSACSCAAGYAGANCASCAAGFNFNGSACVKQVCSPGAVNTDTASCSAHGSHSQTCDGNGASWGAFGSCACSAGYSGGSCSSCADGYYFNVAGGGVCSPQACSPNAAQVDTTSCSAHGLRTRSCTADGAQWSAYNACTCSVGFIGANCSSCDATKGFTLVDGTCKQTVAVSYVMTEMSAAYNTGTISVDANLMMTSAQGKSINPAYGNTSLTTWSVASGDTVTVNCSGGTRYGAPWPAGNPSNVLIITDQNGNQIFNRTNPNEAADLSTSFTPTYPNAYQVDCHSSRIVDYQIGVQYQFSAWAKEWGEGDALYAPLQSVGTSVGGFSQVPNQRVARLYPERQPLVNGQGKWLDIWDNADVNSEIDMMKNAGIDYILYLTEWERNGDSTLPTGFYGYGSELDAFVEANKHRAPAQQVKITLLMASNHITVGYTGRNDFLAIFRAKMQFAIKYFGTKDDAGNSLYYFHDGKPVMSWWEGAAFMNEAAQFGSSGAELISISQQMAKDAGYMGVYWIDSSNTIFDRTMNNAHGGNYVLNDFTTYEDMIAETGFNAETAFIYQGIANVYGANMQYNGFAQAIQAYSAIWNGMIPAARKHANFKYFPVVSPGWDSRAIGEMDQPSLHDQSRSCDGAFDNHNFGPSPWWGCSPDGGLFKTMLTNAKSAIDQNQDATDKMLIIGTWNDVLEGTYLIPTVGDHGAHAQAVHDVFKP